MKRKNSSRFPVVLLDKVDSSQLFMKETQKLGWRLVDLDITDGIIPPGFDIVGAIIGTPIDHPSLLWLKDIDCPIVRVGHHPNPMDKQVPAVIKDYEAIGKLAANHFLERHFKNVGYIGNHPWSTSRPLYESFSKYSSKHGCKCHLLRLNVSEPDRTKRFERKLGEVKSWLQNLPKPVGLLIYSDIFAAKVLTMCHSAGLEVPEQVAFLSCGNNVNICETALFPISSIDTGEKALVREAVSILKSLVNNESFSNSPVIIPPVGVVTRQSTDVLAISNPLVAKVIRFIWSNLDKQLSIDEISRLFGVSRSILDHSFKRYLGRTPSAERQRKRLQLCGELLRKTKLTISDIAKTAGFPSLPYLHRSFKDKFGMTLREYRIKHKSGE